MEVRPLRVRRGLTVREVRRVERAVLLLRGERLSTGKTASTGQASAQAPQSMQDFGSMYSISVRPKSGSSGVGWMQLTGHTETQVASPQHVWVMA